MGTEEDYLPPRSDSLRRAVAPRPRTPVTPHRTLLCRVETQLCFVTSFFFFFLVIVFFYTTCDPLLCLFFHFLGDFSTLFPSLCTAKCCRTAASATRSRAWLPQFERKGKKSKKKKKSKKNGNSFKTDKGRDKREMPCTIFCGCCVHVSPPITNVTFQLH